MEALTPEIAAGLFRASGIPVICTRGERVACANPAAQELLGEDPAGKHASAILPEALRSFATYRMLVYAIVLIVVMLVTNASGTQILFSNIKARFSGEKEEEER